MTPVAPYVASKLLTFSGTLVDAPPVKLPLVQANGRIPLVSRAVPLLINTLELPAPGASPRLFPRTTSPALFERFRVPRLICAPPELAFIVIYETPPSRLNVPVVSLYE